MFSKTDFLRFIALVIDSFFVGFVANLLFSLVIKAPELNPLYRFELVCFLAYFVIFDIRNDGQTLGKMAVNLKPRNKNLKQRIRHSFLKIISIIIFPITIVVYLIKGKIIHDMILENQKESLYS